MSHSFTCVRIHMVFSTKNRLNLISPGEIQNKLYNYIAGIVTNGNHGHLIKINGMPDHVHLYLDLKRTTTIANTIKDIKSGSTLWLNKNFMLSTKFAWQTGYGAFSVSPSQENRISDYIAKQEEHHRKISFKEEYLRLLKKHGIEYDDRYVFE